MFSSVLKIVDDVASNPLNGVDAREAAKMLEFTLERFDFALCLILADKVFGITHALSEALQRKDQDIVNAIILIRGAKMEFAQLQDQPEEWATLLAESIAFCNKFELDNVPVMHELWQPLQPRRRGRPALPCGLTNEAFYKDKVFLPVVQQLRLEMDRRFNDEVIEMMMMGACFQPTNNFQDFSVSSLLQLATKYPGDFPIHPRSLETELTSLVGFARTHPKFTNLAHVSDVARAMVDSKAAFNFPLTYRLLVLVLTIPVSTATTER
jgi:hypothetical protein